MKRRIICICMVLAVLLALAACVDIPESAAYAAHEYGDDYEIDHEAVARAGLLAQGWDEDTLDSMVADGLSLRNIYNQSRFMDAAQAIMQGEPYGPSGEVIASQYLGGIYFDELGILNVTVLAGAFNHPASVTAIDEMQAMGIIVYVVEFNQQDITAAIDRLNNMHQLAQEAGATSWGQGAENGVTIWLDPYTPEQMAIFVTFLQAHNIDPAIFIITPAVTPEMRDHRANNIAEAAAHPRDIIALVGDVEVSRTGIAFSLENRTSESFGYGAPWDLAYFYGGQWIPVTHLPGAGGGMWTMEGYDLQAGGIKSYRVNFEWFFGELAPGRYMFIRDGWLGGWSRDMPRTFAVVEFEITTATPLYLPPEPEEEWLPYLQVVSHSNVTPVGMRVVVENISAYDIDHRAQLIFIVPAEHTTTGYPWEWWEYHLPILQFEGEWEDHFMQGHGFIPAGGRLEFDINWEAIFGELPPGDYKIDLSIGGQAHPPHPTGWGFGDGLIAFTVG